MSQTYWEDRYQTHNMPWEKGTPSPGLLDFLNRRSQLPGETVCVPGGGTGHDACAWSRSGFRVYGYDIAPSAVRLSHERATANELSAAFRQADFLRTEPPFLFDWLFEHTLFCAIQPQERDLYTAAVRRWLKPGGHFLAIHYLIPDEDGPPFGTTKEEILGRFAPFMNLLEDWIPPSYPNRTGLEHMFWWRRI